MKLNELKLRSFRNYQEIAAQFDPGVNLIVGEDVYKRQALGLSLRIWEEIASRSSSE